MWPIAEEMVNHRMTTVTKLQRALKPILQRVATQSKLVPNEEEVFDETNIAIARLCVAVENIFFDGLRVSFVLIHTAT